MTDSNEKKVRRKKPIRVAMAKVGKESMTIAGGRGNIQVVASPH
jgi:hypothetical protein